MERDPSADDMGDADDESELLCGDEVDGDDDDRDEPSSIFLLAATGGCHALQGDENVELMSQGNSRANVK